MKEISRGRLLGLLFLFLTLGGFAKERYLPAGEDTRVEYKYYTIGFNKACKQANWVYYELTSGHLSGKVARKNDFRVDPSMSHWSATPADYKGSGYDRGHLCPAADMSFDPKAMSETFYMSNMSPQAPSFNRGIWKELEERVRNRAKRETLHVVTGPVFKQNKGKIGTGKVTVPGYFYKLFYSPSKKQMVAYVLPNEESRSPLSRFIVPVDEVEELTGIDFFPQLPDELEEMLEADTLSHVSGSSTTEQTVPVVHQPTREQQIIAVVGITVLFLIVLSFIKRKKSGGKKKKGMKGSKRKFERK